MLKLLIVDDSALMRQYLREIFAETGAFDIRTARDGVDGLAQVHEFQPDVVTLDINMPGMDGLACLSRIMVESPRPVVMVSSMTKRDAFATFEALQMGAVDYLAKPGGTVSLNLKLDTSVLIEKVRVAARARIRQRVIVASPDKSLRPPGKVTQRVDTSGKPTLVLIGTSTGGPSTLTEILPLLPADFPWPVLVAQHMTASFTKALANRLANLCALQVEEVLSPIPLQAGQILIARGEADVVLVERNGAITVRPMPADPKYIWHPSIERMVQSALKLFVPSHLIAVQLTGMGYDGADAMTELRKRGGHTIAESKETAIIFGMPNELITRGGAEVVLPANRIATQLAQWV